jgi:hypothetical protein
MDSAEIANFDPQMSLSKETTAIVGNLHFEL